MDIIIPYIHSDFNELLFALRSICKLQEHDKVILVGDKPEWYTGAHIPCSFILGRPEFDVTTKILTAIPHSSPDFILWQDDIYKLNSNPIKPVYCDTIKNAVERRQNGRFLNILDNTAEVFPDGYYYGGHTPMVINGKLFERAVKDCWKKDLVPKTMYGNYAKIGGTLVQDCKLRGDYSYQSIKRFISNRDYLSTGHYDMRGDMVKVLEELYPEKCKYEK